jgi:putative ABC transport system ATP-binding protein
MLIVKDMRKIFNPGTINEKIALDKVDLSLDAGDFVTIIGSNGAGKSTLLNAIAGVFPVDKGKVELSGEDITWKSEENRAVHIGRVFQDPMLGTAASMTIEENLALAMKRGEKRRFKRAIGKKEREFFQEKLAVLGLGLENRLSTKVGLLSGGQRQALTLLMATIKEPKLLLLDEHTAALDPKTGKKVLELTEEVVANNQLTTLMITHNLEVAMAVGNRTIMLHEGNIVLDLEGQKRQHTSISSLLNMFGKGMVSDRMLLG